MSTRGLLGVVSVAVLCLLVLSSIYDARLDNLERDRNDLITIDEGQTDIDSGLITEVSTLREDVDAWTTPMSVLVKRVQELERRAGAVTTSTSVKT